MIKANFRKAVSALLLVFCGATSGKENANLKVITVSDYEFTINNKPAVTVYFGENDSNYCSLTLLKESAKTVAKVESINSNNPDTNIDCNWNGKYFVLSSNHKTYEKAAIKSIDKEKNKAALVIDLKVVEPNTGEFFELKDVKLEISEQLFKNLIK